MVAVIQRHTGLLGALVAEPDVRVRVRGRIVRVDVQRRQVRVVHVVATAEPAHGTVQLPCCPLDGCVGNTTYRTQPHQLAATPIRLPCRRLAWISASSGAGPPLCCFLVRVPAACRRRPLWSVPRLSGTVFTFGGRGYRRAVSVFVFDCFSGGRSPFGPRGLRFRARYAHGSTTAGCAHRCRTRCSRPCTRAHWPRRRTTETGTCRPRCRHGGTRARTSSQ